MFASSTLQIPHQDEHLGPLVIVFLVIRMIQDLYPSDNAHFERSLMRGKVVRKIPRAPKRRGRAEEKLLISLRDIPTEPHIAVVALAAEVVRAAFDEVHVPRVGGIALGT